jgi:predicted amidohydrolase
MASPTDTPVVAPRPTLRVAAVQAAPVAYDLYKSLHKLRSLAFTARENGAEMVVFPEVSGVDGWVDGWNECGVHSQDSSLQTRGGSARRRRQARLADSQAYLSGYPRHLDFRIGSRTQESRDWYGRYVRVSPPLGI